MNILVTGASKGIGKVIAEELKHSDILTKMVRRRTKIDAEE